jgi:DNA ligase-1
MPVPAAQALDPAVQLPSNAVPALMLAKYWQADLDPASFLVSEKLDGVRAFWDGRTLRFRSGRPISAPLWFTNSLPGTPLDGELWLGRGSFDRLSAIVRRKTPVESEWREVRYVVFDLPQQAGPFADRVARIESLINATQLPWLQAAGQWRVADNQALQAQLRQRVAEGAEGLVLHRADANWKPGRSDALRKLKMMPDEEARVFAYLPGKGRLAGQMGALVLEMPSGQHFALGTGFSAADRAAPPLLGSWVSYRYRDRTASGLPRFASFLRRLEAE